MLTMTAVSRFMKYIGNGVKMDTQAYLEGYKAYEDYKHLSDCPYSYMTETSEAYQWSEGFLEAKECRESFHEL